MADVWQELKESLVGEVISVQTTEALNPRFNSNEIRAWILQGGELLRCLTLVENVNQAAFKSAKKQLLAMLTEVGFKPLKTPKDYSNSIYYQKSGDPRTSQKVITLSLAQIEQVTALLQDERFTSCIISYGYSGTVDGMSVYGYTLICKGADVETERLSITQKGVDVILMDLDQLLRKHRWTKQESEVDSRGGMSGSAEYSRS